MKKVSLKEWPAYVERLGERSREAVKRGLLSGALRCIPLLQQRTEKAVPASQHGRTGAFNTGRYRRDWRAKKTANGSVVYNAAPYAGTIEKGRRPGAMPPLGAIEEWARRRLQLSAKEAKQAAYPIARAIKRRGLRGRNVMGGVRDDMAELVKQEVLRELKAEIAR